MLAARGEMVRGLLSPGTTTSATRRAGVAGDWLGALGWSHVWIFSSPPSHLKASSSPRGLSVFSLCVVSSSILTCESGIPKCSEMEGVAFKKA